MDALRWLLDVAKDDRNSDRWIGQCLRSRLGDLEELAQSIGAKLKYGEVYPTSEPEPLDQTAYAKNRAEILGARIEKCQRIAKGLPLVEYRGGPMGEDRRASLRRRRRPC